MFDFKHRLFASMTVASMAGLLLTGVLLITDNPVAEFVQQKFLSLRYRAAQYLPQPEQPAFVPTPLNVAVEAVTPTLRPESILPSPTITIAAADASPELPTRTPAPVVRLAPVQAAVALQGVQHEYQGWNNCGPTTLKMYLGYYGKSDTQKEIAAFTKPDPDDKNVGPKELSAYTQKTGMRVLFRENGTLDQLKLLMSNGLPVMIETGFVTPDGKEGWMGHYKLLVGYDDRQFTFMDSYNGLNQKITFADADVNWRAFNRLYLIVYPADKDPVVRAVVGDELDDRTMYANGAARARAEIEANPKDALAYFSLGTSLNGLKRYGEAAAAYDRARVLGLPWRMLWYQFGPYEAYLQVGRYQEVVVLSDVTLRSADDLEESHYYKGLALRALRRGEEARREFQAALTYNKNYDEARRALETSLN